MNEKITINYKNARIEFDTKTEEWVAYFDEYNISEHEFKRNTSLQKLKDAIDRFHKKEFKPIPVILFDDWNDGKFKNAEIISFTSIPGECWIKFNDTGRRERINTIKSKYGTPKKIYACGNLHNEPIIMKIFEADDEIYKANKELQQLKKKRAELIDSLQTFDIGGYAESEEADTEEIN